MGERGPRSTARAAAICLVSGAALSLAFPEPDIFFLAWVALAPLVVVVPPLSAGGAAVAGLAFGIGFFGSLLSWISLVGWVAWGGLVLLETTFIVLFAWAWHRAHPALGRAGRVAAPVALWIACEYLRSSLPLGGFAWGELAQSQHDQAWILRVASLGGAHAVSAVVMAINGVLAAGWERGVFRVRTGRVAPATTTVAVAAAFLVTPALVPVSDAFGAPLDVAVIQGNVPREWTGHTYEKDLAILDSHVRLTSELRPGDADLIVWPESSVGIDMERDPLVRAEVAEAARRSGTPLIVGGNLDLDDDRYSVISFHIGPTGEVIEKYQKTHLVPFGEYVPRRDWLDFIPLLDQVPRDAVAGSDATLFRIAGGDIAPVLSFEADFSAVVRRQIHAGGDLLVVGTNTSTWGESWASAQHVAMSQVRAAENRVWVAHAALSGISAVIDPAGRVVEDTPLWKPAVIRARVRLATSQTPFTRFGNWVGLGSLLAGIGVLAAAFMTRRRGG